MIHKKLIAYGLASIVWLALALDGRVRLRWHGGRIPKPYLRVLPA